MLGKIKRMSVVSYERTRLVDNHIYLKQRAQPSPTLIQYLRVSVVGFHLFL